MSPRRVFEKTVWLLRGFVWCYSHLLMLAWTGTGLLFPDRAAGLALGVEEATSLGSCLWRSFEQRDVVADCYEVMAGQATWFIPWSLLGFFWIYWEVGLERHPEKKLVGAQEYIWLEAAIYAFRMLCWALFARGWFALPGEVAMRVHLGMFFLSFMVGFSLTLLLVGADSSTIVNVVFRHMFEIGRSSVILFAGTGPHPWKPVTPIIASPRASSVSLPDTSAGPHDSATFG
jgi:hypothetical protein